MKNKNNKHNKKLRNFLWTISGILLMAIFVVAVTSISDTGIITTGTIDADGNINATGNITVGGGVFITCPDNFTSIESQGRQLGCMQDDEQGTTNWAGSTLDCFSTYGGRLPGNSELFLAFNNYELLNESDDSEWVDVSFQDNTGTTVSAYWDGPNDKFWGILWTTNTISYRCFIPT